MIKIMNSPVTNKIYIGTVNKKGEMGEDRTESTFEAYGVVAENLNASSKAICYKFNNTNYVLALIEEHQYNNIDFVMQCKVVEMQNADSTEWGLSFDGCNPEDEYFFKMDKDTAFRLQKYLTDTESKGD